MKEFLISNIAKTGFQIKMEEDRKILMAKYEYEMYQQSIEKEFLATKKSKKTLCKTCNKLIGYYNPQLISFNQQIQCPTCYKTDNLIR